LWPDDTGQMLLRPLHMALSTISNPKRRISACGGQ
jgi:hypothetical protein